MSYLSLLIALFMTGEVPPEKVWLDVYLDKLVVVERFFLNLSWWIFGIAIVVAIIWGAFSLLNRSLRSWSLSLGCGCLALVLLSLPLFEWITLKLAIGMAEAVGPQGMIDSGKFWVHLIIYILIGLG